MSFRRLAFAAFPLAVALGALGCPSSEDDGPLCNDSKCGPGVCLQFCGADAAKEGAADVVIESSASDATSDGDAAESDGGADGGADATEGG